MGDRRKVGRQRMRDAPDHCGHRTAEHVFASGVPSHGLESFRMSFYAFHYGKEPLRNASEVVIEKFEYLP